MQFVHPLSRQTEQIARPIPCKNIPQNLIALDPSDENSEWYMLTPTPVKQQPPKLLKPNNYKRKLNHNTMSAADAGLYTNEDVTEF